MKKETEDLLIDDTRYETEVPEGSIREGNNKENNPKEICAIIPGSVFCINVKKGQNVSAGDVVIILEAMKMYNDIEAETGGVVSEIFVTKGDRVKKGQLMVKLN